MHDEVIRFHLDGEIIDGNIVRAKEQFVKVLEDLMKEQGCVPSIDLEPQFTLDFKPDTETFDFHLSVYGIHVGSDEAWQTQGVTIGRKIPKHTAQDK